MKPQRRPKKAYRVFAALFGGLLGIGLTVWAQNVLRGFDVFTPIHIAALACAVMALGLAFLFFVFSGRVLARITRAYRRVMNYLADLPAQKIALGASGLLLGLLIAFLLTPLFSRLPSAFLYIPLSILLYLGLGWAGMQFMLSRKDWTFPFLPRRFMKDAPPAVKSAEGVKLLDTSAIIDGRIFDIARIGFIDGMLVAPSFVLEELQRIADSSEATKRNRGRRGLELLEECKKALPDRIRVEQVEYPDVAEVDSKLLRLAQSSGAAIVTNDYNLNKVAGVQDVPVLNINELANAIKPLALPGEEMLAAIVKEGKESGQGVAYLDDGTMIVVEGGKRTLGDTVPVIVTSVLQTAAGRMIFARLK